jgi:hypothetical protein
MLWRTRLGIYVLKEPNDYNLLELGFKQLYASWQVWNQSGGKFRYQKSSNHKSLFDKAE